MFDKLLGLSAHTDRMSEAFMWRWAEAHPVLFTIIKVTDYPWLIFGAVFVGYHAIKRMIRSSR
jgi:hypothetical protein